MRNLRLFLDELSKKRELLVVHAPVDPHLELAEIHRRVVQVGGPALLFKNVVGSSFPVVTNLFGTKERVDLAFGKDPEIVLRDLLSFLNGPIPPSIQTLWKKRSSLRRLFSLGSKRSFRTPIEECQIDSLEALPFITSWPEDGGPFLTLPLIYTESPSGKPPNLGMYRVQRFDGQTAGLHFQIGKGGGFHLEEAEARGEKLPVSIFLGGPPAAILSAIAPLPENVPELLFASFVLGEKLLTSEDHETGHFLFGEAEFALLGFATPHERKEEGPFGDHYGYYSLKHPFPFFKCQKILHRKGAIFPATVVGKPRQEDFYIGNYLQELLSPLFPFVMPGVKELWSYGETGFHSLTGAVVKERFKREGMGHAFRILGEGQLSLTKFLLLTDQPVSPRNFKPFLKTILERFDPRKDLHIFSDLSLDTLDYTGPKLNEGSRGVLIGMGEKIRDLPEELTFSLPAPYSRGKPFLPGCLVVEASEKTSLEPLFNLKDWPLVIVVSSLEETFEEGESSFLWTVFTRFEPAADIHVKTEGVFRHRPIYTLPIVIDARMKSHYPKVVEADQDTKKLVSKRWSEYFSNSPF